VWTLLINLLTGKIPSSTASRRSPVVNRRGFTLLRWWWRWPSSAWRCWLFDLNAGAVNSHAYAKRLTVATMLARSKMTDLEQELYDKGFDTDDQERSGDFKGEGWEAFTWKAQILAPRTANVSPDKLIEALFNIPAGPNGGIAGLASLFGGGRDGGVGALTSSLGGAGGLGALASAAGGLGGPLPPGATGPSGLQALGPMGALAQTQMTQLLDQIQKGVREVHLTVSWKEGKRTESIDVVTDVVSLRPGSDRNAHPELPSASSTTGCPECPSCRRGQGAFPRRNPAGFTGAPTGATRHRARNSIPLEGRSVSAEAHPWIHSPGSGLSPWRSRR
jgi:general secretion pathway protein I